MKIVVYGPDKRVGVWMNDLIVDVAPDLLGFIEGGAAALAEADRTVKAALAKPESARAASGVYARSAVQLHAPLAPGARVACAGGNFADHAAAMANRDGNVMDPSDMQALKAKLRAAGIWGFWKVGRDAAGPDAEIMYPARTKRLDYEGELAIVLGKRAKDFTGTDLKPYIWGVTLFGDWSIRDQNEGSFPLKFGMQKNFDGSMSVGPCIVAGEDIDPNDVDVETWVNGDRRQQFNTRDMIVTFAEYLQYITADFTLYPGDMITGGTAKGTAADSSPRLPQGGSAPERFLKPGDEVEMRSPVVGTLAARIVQKHG